ncbi:unnamed protein product [Triticum turgidum subsp. durum]|uniref:Uncharacterized protein n=1 Tax=Triticum turgidum subsp. durum TaxID=4567 RepID=A0A9R0Q1H4_TRITD|nr:unnamed protein product [Triticum turgidum subsp. durum]
MDKMHKEEAIKTTYHEDTTSTDGSRTDVYDPSNPPYPPCPPAVGLSLSDSIRLVAKWSREKEAALGALRASSIIFPERIPKEVNHLFHDKVHHLAPILEKDSVRRFLSYMERNGQGMQWDSIITPEALNHMISQNAVKCVKIVLEGQAPELDGCRADPNCMNQYGYYPLHRAAEFFSVDMIQLLVRHGASANLRTAGAEVIEGLLPLHVAVENTCMHKYLEDSLFPNHEHRDYSEADANFIFKLIHLLCLPDMKIFLDTTRLIAKYTDNLLDELWNYIKEGKLAETAVLLMAAQEQIRMGTSRKRNGDSKPDGLAIICDRIWNNNIALQSEKGQQVEARIKLNNMALMLVHVISKAGEGLDSYIQKHLEVPYFMQVPRLEVIEHVSLILKDNGFCPTSEWTEIGNLCPYEDVLSSEDIPNKSRESDTNREALEMDYLQTVVNKATRKRKPRRWELKLARRSFFPWWRSVLSARSKVKIIPHKWARPSECLDLEMAWKKPTQGLDGETASKKATVEDGSAAAGHGVMGRFPMVVYSSKPGELFTTIPLADIPKYMKQQQRRQSRRLFSTAVNYQPRMVIGTGVNPQPGRRLFGTAALMLLKVLKKA